MDIPGLYVEVMASIERTPFADQDHEDLAHRLSDLEYNERWDICRRAQYLAERAYVLLDPNDKAELG